MKVEPKSAGPEIGLFEAQLRKAAESQPGCKPYTSTRPIRIPGRMQGSTLGECLRSLCPHIEPARWSDAIADGRLKVDGRSFELDENAFGGMEVLYTIEGRTEPAVATDIRIIGMDQDLVVLQKPAPLAVHPCGRFNKNTLLKLIEMAWPEERLRPAHRIDAATTGILVLTRNKKAAHFVQSQFANRTVKKTYLVKAEGKPERDAFSVDAKIDLAVGDSGRRQLSGEGAEAHTDFEVVRRYEDGTCLLFARPISGRTNQIRLHLQACGLPIVGDNAYGADEDVEGGMVSDKTTLHLHAHSIEFVHPANSKLARYEANSPDWADIAD